MIELQLRDGILAVALVTAVVAGVWGWGQQKLLETEQVKAQNLQEDARRNLATATELQTILRRERTGQAKLLKVQGELRQGLADRERKIEDLKHENDQLRAWAEQPLPDAARRLRERPAITGAGAYRQWLSGSGALHPAGDGTEQQRPVAD